MSTRGVTLRTPIVVAVALLVVLLALAATVASRPATPGPRGISAELLTNKNDGKDNCPTDGNAGKGNDDKGPNGGCRPPKGQYGKVGGNG